MYGRKRSNWYPLGRFTKSPCHFDWMMGMTKFPVGRDCLDATKTIGRDETVFWNRTFGVNVALSTYRKVQETRDPDAVAKCERIGLPLDIRV